MRYVTARYSQSQREWAYRIYVTDALKILGGLNMRYADAFTPDDPRTANEVIDGIKGKLRRLGGE